MSNTPEPESTGRFHTLQPHRDLESNWAVDLAKNLEEYLLKICSGEITSDGHDVPQLSVNFAEAALLLQGSVQVYSRKVEYLYSLVLHTLEFISQKSSQEQPTSASASDQPEASVSRSLHEEENDTFWGLDDIPVEAKNLLDDANGKDTQVNYLVRPPANLVVLEGDCLDAIGDAGELESYLLATNDLFRDFILLDSCDALAVNDFLNSQNKAEKVHSDVCKGSSLNSKSHKSFLSPTRRSGGTGHKLSAQKNQHADLNESPLVNHCFESNDCGGVGSSPPTYDFAEDDNGHFNMENRFSDESDSDDPWKPLNPHEPGNLKVKPFRKGKINRRSAANSRKHNPLMAEFPIARFDGPISEELTKMWEAKCSTSQKQDEPHSPPLYEKLRESLVLGGNQGYNVFPNPAETNTDNGYDNEDAGNDLPDFDMPENTYEDVPQQDKDDGNIHLNPNEGHEDPNIHGNLEDLCRSHLDSLLASLAETEKQTEMAARVSTWKQRIEQNLEEQDSRPPFDIHEYGDRVLGKLYKEGDIGSSMSFGDVVKGQAKHDIARTFSALLQLVNNGDVELRRSGGCEPICYTADNPFHVRLLRNKKQSDELKPELLNKRANSPKERTTKGSTGKENRQVGNVVSSISTSSCRFSVKVGKPGVTRCTPEGKKRRKSRFILQDETA